MIIHNCAWISTGGHSVWQKIPLALTSFGWTGVQLFFVLSGFLITGILVDERGTPQALRRFYIRRALRILPLYFTALLAVMLLARTSYVSAAWATSVHDNIGWYWLFLSNWVEPFGGAIDGIAHFWSLAVEEQFYLVWPFAIGTWSGYRPLTVVSVVIVAAPLTRLALHLAGEPPGAGYGFTIARWDALAVGSLVLVLHRSPTLRTRLRRTAHGWTVGALLGLAAIVLYEHGFHENEPLVQIVGQSLVSIVCAAMLYACLDTRPSTLPYRRLVAMRWLRTTGKYSYAMYIFHMPIHRSFNDVVAPWVNGGVGKFQPLRLGAYVCGILALSFAAAWTSWRLVEAPCLTLRDRWAPRVH